MDWNTANARQHFSTLLQAAHEEPQRIFSRNTFVAAVIDAEMFEAFKTWQDTHRSVGGAFRELRQICREESYHLEIPPRQDRDNAWNPEG